MIMKRHKFATTAAIVMLVLTSGGVQAEVIHQQINSRNLLVEVSDDPWQPEGFTNGRTIPATYLHSSGVVIDGKADESAWGLATEIEVPLAYGPVKFVYLKAVYTDQEVFIRVRWADDDEDRQYRPWVWNAEQKKYVEGPQLEDSVMLSFEAGCEWEPSFLAGYIYDFDAWHWLAARSDPMGQAVDLYGNVQDQSRNNPLLIRYNSRQTQDTWNVKFTDNTNPNLHAGWNDLDRVYMLQPITHEVYVQTVPDGHNSPPFAKQVPAPSGKPNPDDEAKSVPQFVPAKLSDGAGEVSAKGQWEDGYWTVEFRRSRVTPAKTLNDTIFNRLVQFSVHVFDHAEMLDQASESNRLFLQFLPTGQELVSY
jgi:hypothetical protein